MFIQYKKQTPRVRELNENTCFLFTSLWSYFIPLSPFILRVIGFLIEWSGNICVKDPAQGLGYVASGWEVCGSGHPAITISESWAEKLAWGAVGLAATSLVHNKILFIASQDVYKINNSNSISSKKVYDEKCLPSYGLQFFSLGATLNVHFLGIFPENSMNLQKGVCMCVPVSILFKKITHFSTPFSLTYLRCP